MADSGIITMEEYGNVRLKLKERMDSDGINRMHQSKFFFLSYIYFFNC